MKLVESLFKIFIYLIQYIIKEQVVLNTWRSFEVFFFFKYLII